MNESQQERYRAALDERARDLDGATLSRLRAGLLWRQMPGTHDDVPPLSAEAMEIATLDLDLEAIEELEFYEWLSEQDLDAAGGGGPA